MLSVRYMLSMGLLLIGASAGTAQTKDMNGSTNHTETATLGGGCFWCTEAVFQMLPGVKSVTSGYAGGTKENPTYKEVCAGDTGHAEVIQIEYDPKVVSYEKLLETFWEAHDPTTLNRQGNDTGTQYRSGIYFHSLEQEKVAREVLAEVNKLHRGGAVTEVRPEQNYSKAEPYHQHYFANHPNQGYCAMVVAPKVEKFRKTFAARVAS